jgi:hypothetical protein
MFVARPAVVALALISASSVTDDPVVLVINGEPIARSEFEAVVSELNGPVPFSAGTVPASLRPRPTIVEAVDQLIIVQAARQSGFILSDDRFEQLVATMRERRGLANEEQLAAALKRESVSLDELRRSFERHMAWSRLRLDVLSRSQVTEEEARTYYDSHRSEFALSSFEQAKAEIVRSLSTPERDAQAWDAYVKSLRAQAVLEWRDAALRSAYELGIGVQ